jgi:hypothetical protein
MYHTSHKLKSLRKPTTTNTLYGFYGVRTRGEFGTTQNHATVSRSRESNIMPLSRKFIHLDNSNSTTRCLVASLEWTRLYVRVNGLHDDTLIRI